MGTAAADNGADAPRCPAESRPGRVDATTGAPPGASGACTVDATLHGCVRGTVAPGQDAGSGSVPWRFTKGAEARRMRRKLARKRTAEALFAESERTISRVTSRLARLLDLPHACLFTKRRGPQVESFARLFSMALCVRLGVSRNHVARIFGRSWSTVHHAVRACARRHADDPDFRETWDGLVMDFSKEKEE